MALRSTSSVLEVDVVLSGPQLLIVRNCEKYFERMSFVVILWVLFESRPLFVGFYCDRVSSIKRRTKIVTTILRDLNGQNVDK